MQRAFIDSKDFKGIDFTKKHLEIGDYEYCTFVNCTFSDIDLSEISFIECEFKDCNLSLAKLHNTMFRETLFKNCKLLGLRFEHCNKYFFEINFEACILNLSSFYQLDLTRMKFTDCSLHDVDFSESNLNGIGFFDCDLNGAIFDETNIEKVDFRTAVNYSIDPENNVVEKAKFSQSGIVGLLIKYNIEIE